MRLATGPLSETGRKRRLKGRFQIPVLHADGSGELKRHFAPAPHQTLEIGESPACVDRQARDHVANGHTTVCQACVGHRLDTAESVVVWQGIGRASLLMGRIMHR